MGVQGPSDLVLAFARVLHVNGESTADPTGVDMDRVACAVRAIDHVAAGQLAPGAAMEAIRQISHAPPAPTWLFTLAAAAGAVLRRTLAHYTANALLQPLGAALLAGVVGALAVRYQLSSSLRLVAVCPCMILVPGPHVLNGMMDLAAVR